MLRTTILKAARPSMAVSRAAFTTTARALGAGDTGAPPKTGGFGYVIAPSPSPRVPPSRAIPALAGQADPFPLSYVQGKTS
jgi:hypothetical protein